MMKDYLDGFDARVSTRAMEITTSLDQRLVRTRVAGHADGNAEI